MTDYKEWNKEELKDECRRLRLKVGGNEEDLILRLKKETRSQPRLIFKRKEDVDEPESSSKKFQGKDQENEGGGEDQVSSLQPDLDDDDQHWVDMPPEGGGRAKKGDPSTSALKSPRRSTPMYTGKKPKGFWLGRKASLKNGEAPRSKNSTRGRKPYSGESLITKGSRVNSSGSRGKLGLGEATNFGPELQTTQPNLQPPD